MVMGVIYIQLCLIIDNLVGGWATPLKNMSSSVGMIRNPIDGTKPSMFQTTNQFCSHLYLWSLFELVNR